LNGFQLQRVGMIETWPGIIEQHGLHDTSAADAFDAGIM
jgi:hypothetical protein